MNKMAMTAILGCIVPLCFAQAAAMATQSSSPERVSIFKVSLQCPAAPQIGCGSASKPILLELERDPAVRQAWLNRAGTLIAVVWKSQPNAKARQQVSSRLRGAGCCAKETATNELQGEARDKALREFQFGHGWYRAADVDRLSKEEAGVIAARWVRRVKAKTQLPEGKAHELERALAQELSKCLVSGDQRSSQLENVARKYLNQEQLKIFKQAVQGGVRPLPHES